MTATRFDSSQQINGHLPSLQRLFAEQVFKTPHYIALKFNGVELSYQQLEESASAYADVIISKFPTSSIIGISTTRRIDMVAGVLGILKSGRAYLPIDAAYPTERLQQMISDAGLLGCLAPFAEQGFFEGLGLSVISAPSAVDIDTALSLIQQPLAYVLFTSGSTGKPKGVCMGHNALINLIEWQSKASVATIGTNTLQFAPLNFDVSFQEMFATLTTGGTLILIDDDARLDPHLLLDFINDNEINRLFLPFVALQGLAETAVFSKKYPGCLREIMTAGEQLKITPQVRELFINLPGATLYNQYGPTECHVVTELKLTGDANNWPALPSIGKAIDNVEILILDGNLQKIGNGEAGELYISGTCLAQGYLNRPDLTDEKFISWMHPFRGEIKIYKSGDQASMEPDGTIKFLGRNDDQVKIRGYRIEPAEVEIALNHLPGIEQAVVTVKTDKYGQNLLVAYLLATGQKSNVSVLREQLSKFLPDYMIPATFMWMDTLPKTSSGKVDKKALPQPVSTRPDLSVLYRSPLTTAEQQIQGVWCELLGIDDLGVDDNFFELGGNSLMALKTITRLKQSFGFNLPVTKFYQTPTIAGIANYLTGKKEDSNAQPAMVPAAGKDIAVIGMAGRFPGANNVEELWELLKAGSETISHFTDQELDSSISNNHRKDPDYVKSRGIIEHAEDFDALFFNINPKVAELMDPQQRIFLEIAWEALESAGYLPQIYKGVVGVFAGCGNNSYYVHNVLPNEHLIEHVGSFQVMTANEKDYIATRTAYQLNLKGPAVSVHTGCSTSLLAIAQAVESLRAGRCQVALAGGVSITSPLKSGYLYKDGAMLSPDGHCRPFDAQAQGTVFSDGAGVVLLKPLDQAIKDGDTIYSIIKGIGVNNDGNDKASFVAPSALGQSGAIKMAVADAGVQASSIAYIETHGTATLIGDPIEIEGLKGAFGSAAGEPYCALSSLKSNMGHLTAAAGVAGFIKATLALYHQQIPASINYSKPNPHLGLEDSPFYVNQQLTSWQSSTTRRAGVSSFGVGGTNVHIVLEEGINSSTSSAFQRPLQLITWSAKNEVSLDEYGKSLGRYLGKHADIKLADAAYTLQTTRPGFEQRRFLTAANSVELIQAIESQQYQTKNLSQKPSGVVFLFAGQGSQFVGMCHDLYKHELVFTQAVDECATILQAQSGENILNVIFPEHQTNEVVDKLNNTYYTQPALFVVEYALARLWMSWGIQPIALCGHSIGEFVAAHLAGVFNLEDALKLVAGRGRIMSEQLPGSMIAVRAGVDQVKALLPLQLSVAAVNTPGNTVVSGALDVVDNFATKLQQENVPSRVLKTSHAFHSAMMDGAVAPFMELVNTVTLNPPLIPIASTATGKWLTAAEATSAKYWAQQLRKPVLFAQAIELVAASNNPVLLEIGPGNGTTPMAQQNLTGKNISVIASLDAGVDKQPDNLAIINTLGKLWLQGIEPDWQAFYAGQQRQKIKLPTYVFNRKRCWVEPPVKQQPANMAAPQSLMITAPQPQQVNSRSADGNEKLAAKVRQIIEDASGVDMQTADPNASFIELGLDSLLLTQVTLTLKNEFKLPLTFRKLNEGLHTLNLLTHYLFSNLPEWHAPFEANNNVSVVQHQNADLASIAQQLQLLAQQVSILQGGQVSSNAIPGPAPVQQQNDLQISAEEAAELKKPFGATARIERQARHISEGQRHFLTEFTLAYNQKTAGSKAYTQQHRMQMADPRVVSGFRPQTKELVYPIVVNRSKGSKLWDIDGNEYIDVLNGFGSNMLGYQPDVVKKAVQQQVEEGYEIGPQHHLAGELCSLICEFTNFDRAALCNTGSEAVLGAMRIARTVTGRSTIVAFSGSYHGIADEVIVRGTKKLKSFPAAPGIMPEAVQNMLILDYGTDETLQFIKQHAHEFAAVLVEPIQSRRPEFRPVEFLKQLRQITAEAGTVLIFDEVISGFRMHRGGAQALFDVKADIGTYGKVIGGGMPIGAIAGKKQFMDALDGGFWQFGDDSIPEVGVTYFAGTFVRHPLALAAGKASLLYMKAKGPQLQEQLTHKTEYLANAINQITENRGLPLFAAQFGSLWKLKFKEEIPYSELLFTLMRYKGIHIWDNFPCFLTEAHSQKEVDTIIEKFKESIEELISAGFLVAIDANKNINAAYTVEKLSPVSGARLGRDQKGNPAWFIPDADRPGKFLKVEPNY
jgi:amino acid adenylation domain-containing protein